MSDHHYDSPILRLWSRLTGPRGRKVGAILAIALRTFSEQHGAQAAAGMAFYALFAMFPLLLFLVALGTLFLRAEEAHQQVYQFVGSILPVSQELLIENLEQVLRNRGAFGAVAAISLLWSASGFFVILARNVSRAWSDARLRSFLEGRLLAFAIISGLASLLFVSFLADAVLRFIAAVQPALWPGSLVRRLLDFPLFSQLLSGLLAFFFLLVLYRQVPRVHVRWRDAGWAALFAALAWRLGSAAFVWYLRSGLARYSLVYGSLSSVVVLLFWTYLSNEVILLGAHLCSAIALSRRIKVRS